MGGEIPENPRGNTWHIWGEILFPVHPTSVYSFNKGTQRPNQLKILAKEVRDGDEGSNYDCGR